jgi:hypothetical protein
MNFYSYFCLIFWRLPILMWAERPTTEKFCGSTEIAAKLS